MNQNTNSISSLIEQVNNMGHRNENVKRLKKYLKMIQRQMKEFAR